MKQFISRILAIEKSHTTETDVSAPKETIYHDDENNKKGGGVSFSG